MADMAVAGALVRTWRYIRSGDTVGNSPSITILGARLVAGAFASLTPAGPERGLNAIVSSGPIVIRGQLSAVDSYSQNRLWATAVSARWRTPRRIWPRASIEVRQAESSDAERSRLIVPPRGQATIRGSGSLSGQSRLSGHAVEWEFGMSYKTRGYLPGRRTAAGLSVDGGITLTF
jgi:hypothetical protein